MEFRPDREEEGRAQDGVPALMHVLSLGVTLGLRRGQEELWMRHGSSVTTRVPISQEAHKVTNKKCVCACRKQSARSHTVTNSVFVFFCEDFLWHHRLHKGSVMLSVGSLGNGSIYFTSRSMYMLQRRNTRDKRRLFV